MTTTAVRPSTRRDPLLTGTRVLLGLFGAFKLYGTAYFTFFATAEQGGDPQGLVDWAVASGRPRWPSRFLVAAVRLGGEDRAHRRSLARPAAGRDRLQPVKLYGLRRARGGRLHGRRPGDPRSAGAHLPAACCLIQACMAMPAATPALIERVEPNWAIDRTPSAASRASGDSPLPSWPNSSTQALGSSAVSSGRAPGRLSTASRGSPSVAGPGDAARRRPGGGGRAGTGR